MKTIQKAFVLSMSLSLMATAAEAKGAKKHCMKASTETADTTKKACKASGGKWEKIAPVKDAPKAATP